MERTDDFDLREYLRILRRRAWVVVASILVLGALAGGLSLAQTPVYTASADVLVPQQSAVSQLNEQTNAQLNPQYLQRNIDNAQKFASSDVVKEAATKALGYSAKASVSASSSTDMLTFKASSTDKKKAADVANAYSKAYIDADRKRQVDNYVNLGNALRDRIASLQAQLNSLPSDSKQAQSLASEIASLQANQSNLQAAAQLSSSSGGQVINAAKVPANPSSPKVVRNALLGLALGLLVGIGLAFLVDRLDDSIKSKHDIDEVSAGVPLVGLIPEVSGWRSRSDTHVITLESPQSMAAEAYRTLRTSVQFLGIERPLNLIGVTSPSAGEGKTTTLANLAVSAAKAGLQVVMVCCDLRRPRIHNFFGKSNDVGFTSVLLGETSLSAALQDIEEQPRLRLLASGPTPPNPAELLNVSRVEQVLQSLTRVADLVLIDCPPVIPVTDALLISHMVDGMLLVANAGRTNKRQFHRALELFAQVDAPVIGSVLNTVPSKGGYGYDYGYGYGYRGTYTYTSEADESRRARRRARRQAFEEVVEQASSERPERAAEELHGTVSER